MCSVRVTKAAHRKCNFPKKKNSVVKFPENRTGNVGIRNVRKEFVYLYNENISCNMLIW